MATFDAVQMLQLALQFEQELEAEIKAVPVGQGVTQELEYK